VGIGTWGHGVDVIMSYEYDYSNLELMEAGIGSCRWTANTPHTSVLAHT
jgi:hypothetical protein